MDGIEHTFVWDVSRKAFTLPFLNLPIYWYGILFATGFFFGYLIFLYGYRRLLAARSAFFPHEIDFQQLMKVWGDMPLLKGVSPPQGKPSRQEQLKICQYLEMGSISEKEVLSSKQRRLSRFLSKKPQVQAHYHKRCILEAKFPQVFVPQEVRAKKFVDRLTLYIVVGTIVGARLGHLLFYENFIDYLKHPLSILNTREGGLASHGGVLGICIALYGFCKKMKTLGETIQWRSIVDAIVIPTAFAAIFIRLGNFVNQEIVGTPSNVPWAVIFPFNFEGLSPVPRHPVQLYESLAYLCSFVLLWLNFRYRFFSLKKGEMSGLFFILIFGARFWLESMKESQLHLQAHPLLGEQIFTVGQWLSIPMILFGIFLLIFSNMSSKKLDQVLETTEES